MSNSEQLSVNLAIVALEILSYEIKPISQGINDSSSFFYDMEIVHQVDASKNRIVAFLKAEVRSTEIEKGETILGAVKLACAYKIENFQEVIKTMEGKPTIPESVGQLINSITISSSRGVFAALFKGTHLQKALLPLFDPKQLQLTDKQKT